MTSLDVNMTTAGPNKTQYLGMPMRDSFVIKSFKVGRPTLIWIILGGKIHLVLGHSFC